MLAMTLVATGLDAQAPLGTPIVVELFTSEGCSSCPPADALLRRLVETEPAGARIIALGEHVDYWDRLGWKDRFSSAALTARQQVYAAHFNNESIYTPQMVVDGRTQFVGSDAAAARRGIDKAVASEHGRVTVALQSATGATVPVSVKVLNLPSIARGDHADILVAVTEDHLQSDVKAGENRGRALAHTAVVRHLTTIGEVTGESGSAATDVTIAPDWKRDQLTVVAFVQQRRGRAVLAAAAAPLVGRQ